MRLFEFNNVKPVTTLKPLGFSNKGELFAYMKKHCSQYLNQAAGHMLFRGLNHSEHSGISVFKAHSPINRVPRDLSPLEQKEIDKALKAAGFKALRSNSAFCTGDVYMCADYGQVYAVAPLNGFQFTWATEIHDALDTKATKGWLDGDIIKRYGFMNTELHSAIVAGHEIYIHGSYLVIDLDFLGLGENLPSRPKWSFYDEN